MTTMSGSKRAACSIASATVPGLGDDLKPSRRSSSATRPCRTTSWSSTIRSRRSSRAGGGTALRSGWVLRARGKPHDDTGAPMRRTLDLEGRRPSAGDAIAEVGPVPSGRLGRALCPDRTRRRHPRRAGRLVHRDKPTATTLRAPLCRATLLSASRAIWTSPWAASGVGRGLVERRRRSDRQEISEPRGSPRPSPRRARSEARLPPPARARR